MDRDRTAMDEEPGPPDDPAVRREEEAAAAESAESTARHGEPDEVDPTD